MTFLARLRTRVCGMRIVHCKGCGGQMDLDRKSEVQAHRFCQS